MSVLWPDLPFSVDQVDPEWLTAALRAGDGTITGTVTAIEREPITAAVGLMGEVTRLRLTWDGADDDVPTSVVAKLPSALEDNRALGQMLGLYEVEHRFYDDLARDVGVRTPHIWFTGAEAGNYAILLEDLGDCERYDQLDGAPIPVAEAMIDALAAMHARFWGLERLADQDWVPESSGEALRPYADLVAGSWPDFDAAIAHLAEPEDRDLVHRFADGFTDLADASFHHPQTLVHRDYRVDNALFRDGDPIIFDWAGAARGGALYDLHYFISGSLTQEDRAAHGERLVDRYLASLVDRGVDLAGAPMDDMHKVNALFCLIIPVMAGGDALNTRDEKGERLIEVGLRRLFDHLHDLDAGSILD
jgi:hypothetical protein